MCLCITENSTHSGTVHEEEEDEEDEENKEYEKDEDNEEYDKEEEDNSISCLPGNRKWNYFGLFIHKND